MNLRTISVAIKACLIAGCATSVTQVKLGEIHDVPITFELLDERPVSSLSTRSEQSSFGDYYYYGDDVVVPNRIKLLATSIQKRLGKRIDGQKVRIADFEVRTFQLTRRGDGGVVPANVNPLVAVAGVFVASKMYGVLARSDEISVGCTLRGSMAGQEIEINLSEKFPSSDIENGIRLIAQKCVHDFVASGATKLGEVRSR